MSFKKSTQCLVEEHERNRYLALVGLGINITFILTFFFWRESLPRLLQTTEAICWPFFSGCRELRPFSSGLVQTVWWSLLVFPVISIFSLWRKAYRTHYFFLLLAFLVKVFVFIQDYRFMGNYHWMPFWATVIYLCSGQKIRDLRWLVVLFYFFAGTLKLNQEWLSGSAMLLSALPSPVPFEALTVAVIVLELILAWGLLLPKWRREVLAVLFFFHLYSWHQVSYFYPLVMACLLVVFFIPETSSAKDSRRPSVFGATILLLLIGLQLVSLVAPSQAVLTGQARYLSLNMFDAHSQCQAYAFYQQRQQWTHLKIEDSLGVRIHCEPLVFVELAKNRCAEFESLKLEGDLHLVLFARKSSDQQWSQLLDLKNVCSNEQVAHLFAPHGFVKFQSSEVVQEGVSPVAYFTKAAESKNEEPEVLAETSLGDLVEQKSLGVWNVGVHTAAKSSPVGDETGFYVASDGGVLAKFTWEGEMLWRFVTQNAEWGIHGTPVLGGDSIYFGTYSGHFYRVLKTSGDVVWVRKLGDAIGASPLWAQESLFVNTEFASPYKWGGMVLRLTSDGKVQWQSEIFPDQSHSTPVLTKDKRSLVFGSNDGWVRWLDVSTGKLVQSVNVATAPSKGMPLVDSEKIYITNWSQGLWAIDNSSGEIRWHDQIQAIAMGSPIFAPKRSSVFYGAGNGELRELSAENGQLLQVFKLGDRGLKSGIQVVGDELFLGCQDTSLCRVNTVTGNVQIYRLDGRVSAKPLVRGKTMVVSTEAPGSLWVLKFK